MLHVHPRVVQSGAWSRVSTAGLRTRLIQVPICTRPAPRAACIGLVAIATALFLHVQAPPSRLAGGTACRPRGAPGEPWAPGCGRLQRPGRGAGDGAQVDVDHRRTAGGDGVEGPLQGRTQRAQGLDVLAVAAEGGGEAT